MSGKEKKPAGKRARGRELFGRRFFAGSYAAVAAALVVAAAVAANAAVSALPERVRELDMTSQSLYTLSDQTKRVAASLDKDVTLYLLATDGGEDDTIARLLSRYADLSERITVEYVDPTLKPTFLDAYDLDLSHLYANSVLVECGGRTRLVGYDEIFVTSYSMDYSGYGYQTSTTFEGESALTNAIHYVSSDAVPKVYALSGHGERELGDALTELMARDGLEEEKLSLISRDAVPEDASALVVAAPQSDLSADEADMLVAYLQGGGRVLLTTDVIASDEMPNLLRVTQAMGLTAGEGLVVEGDASRHVSRYPYYLLPDLGSHEITQPLIDGGYYALLPLCQPIVETGEGGANVTPLLTTSSDAYAKAAGLDTKTTEREEGDAEGPFTVAAPSELGEGKLLWIASADFLEDTFNALVAGGNDDLFLNGLGWMCEQAETISIRAKTMDDAHLALTAAQSRLWSFVLIGAVPLAFVVAGAAVTLRRKRR